MEIEVPQSIERSSTGHLRLVGDKCCDVEVGSHVTLRVKADVRAVREEITGQDKQRMEQWIDFDVKSVDVVEATDGKLLELMEDE